MKRQEVYEAIYSEINYQDEIWKDEPKHSITDYCVYIEDYLNEAKHLLTREPTPIANEKAKHIVRKMAALCVACGEDHGMPDREFIPRPPMKMVHVGSTAFYTINGALSFVCTYIFKSLDAFQLELDKRERDGYTTCYFYSLHSNHDSDVINYWVRCRFNRD